MNELFVRGNTNASMKERLNARLQRIKPSFIFFPFLRIIAIYFKTQENSEQFLWIYLHPDFYQLHFIPTTGLNTPNSGTFSANRLCKGPSVLHLKDYRQLL